MFLREDFHEDIAKKSGFRCFNITSDREYSGVLSPIVILMFGRLLGCLLKAKLRLAIPSLRYL